MMICSKCGEEILGWQTSKSPGVCRDCYVINDMDRLIPASPSQVTSHQSETDAVDTRQEDQSDTGCSCHESDHEHEESQPLMNTNFLGLVPIRWMTRKEIQDMMEVQPDPSWEALDTNIPEPSPQQSPPSADKEDK